MQRLSVLTLNIWNRQGPYEQRLPLIRDGVRRLKPDLVGLQEIIQTPEGSQAEAVAKDLGYHVAFGPAHDLGEGVYFGNAILSRWPIERHKTFPLPTHGTDENRSLLMAAIDSPHGKIPMFVTHLNWKFHHGVVREWQVVTIASHVQREAPMEGLPPILVGDFNAQPEASEIRFIKGLQSIEGKSFYMGDVYEQVGAPPGFTFDARRNPFAAVTHEYPRRIDYIFVRGPDRNIRGKPISAKVVLDEEVEGVTPSDHYGVFAEISI